MARRRRATARHWRAKFCDRARGVWRWSCELAPGSGRGRALLQFCAVFLYDLPADRSAFAGVLSRLAAVWGRTWLGRRIALFQLLDIDDGGLRRHHAAA